MKRPLKGNYLIQNPLANRLFRFIDHSLSLLKVEKNFPIKTPQKILLSNIAHLGDVLLMTSLLPILKKAIPGVQIGVIVGSWSESMVKNHPLIDHVHFFDHWKVARNSSSLLKKMSKTTEMKNRVIAELKKEQYDIAVECSFHFPNTIPLTYKAGIPVRLGYISGGFGPLLTHPLPWLPNQGSVANYMLTLIQTFITVSDVTLKPILPITNPVTVPKPYIIIHMGSGDAIKEWPPEKWKELTHKLSQDCHFLVFTGRGEREAKMIQEISCGLNLCDQLSWSECISLVRDAGALISVDTGIAHVAAAFNTPSILIFTGIHPLDLWCPLSPNAHILTHPVPCSPCHRAGGCAAMSCIKNVSVDAVYEKVSHLIMG
jgi:ADP-heptose:LPS heptosyltransferase